MQPLEDGEANQFLQKRWPMPCNPEVLKHVPLFALLDEDETAVLAGQVELKDFAPRQRIYKMGDPSGHAYGMDSGRGGDTTGDEGEQEGGVDGDAQGGLGPLSFYIAEPDSLAAGGDPGAGDYDEPEPAGHEGSRARRTGQRREPALRG